MRATILPFSLVAHGTIATIRVLLPTQRAQVQALRGQLNLQRFGAPKFQSELQNRQKPAWPIHDKARSGWTGFVRMLNRGPVLFFALRRFAAICRSLAIVSKTANCAEKRDASRTKWRIFSALARLGCLACARGVWLWRRSCLRCRRRQRPNRRWFAPSMGDFPPIPTVIQ